MKWFLYILPLFLLINCSKKQHFSFYIVSKKIYNNNYTNHVIDIDTKKLFYRARMYLLKNTAFLKNKSNCFYFIEAYDAQSGEVIGTVWNQEGKVNYRYINNNIRFESLDLFSVKLQQEVEIGRVSKWVSIDNYFGNLQGIGTNVKILGKKIKITQFEFQE